MRLYWRFTNLNWYEKNKIEKAIAADEHNKDKKDFWEKNKKLKREKQCQKQAAKAKTS